MRLDNDRRPLSWEEQVGAWLAANPRPIPLPKPTRTFEQWVTWLRAEGFIEEIEKPYSFMDVNIF